MTKEIIYLSQHEEYNLNSYDDGMLEWGGENIEQSLRCWMCGGEIVVERNSQVGHIFFRPQPPNKVKLCSYILEVE